jgi:hypothetical protein
VNDLGKLLVIVGFLLILAGVAIWSGVGRNWIGRLPGDINYSRSNFSFHFPIVTCILLSIILTILFRIFRH